MGADPGRASGNVSGALGGQPGLEVFGRQARNFRDVACGDFMQRVRDGRKRARQLRRQLRDDGRARLGDLDAGARELRVVDRQQLVEARARHPAFGSLPQHGVSLLEDLVVVLRDPEVVAAHVEDRAVQEPPALAR